MAFNWTISVECHNKISIKQAFIVIDWRQAKLMSAVFLKIKDFKQNLMKKICLLAEKKVIGTEFFEWMT